MTIIERPSFPVPVPSDPFLGQSTHAGKRRSDRLVVDRILVIVVVLSGLVHLPVLGVGELGSPDPRFQAMLLVPSALGILRAISLRTWRPFAEPVVLLLLASAGWLAVSSLLGPEPIDGLARGIWFSATAITLIGTVERLGLEATLVPASLATAGFIAAGLVLHATGIVDGAWEIEQNNEPLFPWTRLNALGPNQTVIGFSGSLTVLSLFATHRRIGSFGSLIIGGVGLAGIAASHNRSAIAALVVGVVFAALWARRRWSAIVLAGGLAATGIALFSSTVSSRFNRDSLVDDEQFDFYDGAERGVLTGRGEVWSDAWQFGLERPLTGRGNGAFAQFTDERFLSGAARWDPNHTHNTLLEVFVDQGLVGVILLLAASVAIGRRWRDWTPTTAAILGAVMLHGIVEAMFYGSPSSRWTFLVIVVAALAAPSPGDEPPGADRRADEQAGGVDDDRHVHARHDG